MEEVPGLRRRVGVDLGKVTVGERTMLDARAREGVGSESFVVYVIFALLLIARRRARRVSGEEAMTESKSTCCNSSTRRRDDPYCVCLVKRKRQLSL